MPLTQDAINDLLRKISNNNRGLVEVNFAQQKLTKAQIAQLAKGLETNYFLQKLILDGVMLENFGIKAISKALETNENLKYLSVRNNHIGRDGARDVANMLRVNKTLESLRLASNPLMPAGIQDIAEALPENNVLLILNIDCCHVGDGGLIKLGIMLDSNHTLRSLGLACNGISSSAIKQFEPHIANHRSLRHLDIWGNTMDYVFDYNQYDVEEFSTKFVHPKPRSSITSFIWSAKRTTLTSDASDPLLKGSDAAISETPENAGPKLKVRY